MALKHSVLLATAVFAGALGVGGISLASAQESTTTTPDTTTDSTPDSIPDDDAVTPQGDPDCPHGERGSSGSPDSGTSTDASASL